MIEYDDKPRWMFVRRDDIEVPRLAEPVVLSLREATDWINSHRPIPWNGSIFSLPHPSSLPSGAQVSRLLFDSLCPTSVLVDNRDDIFWSEFLPNWPLERIFDLCDSFSLDTKQQILDWFANAESTARPNQLHNSIAKYCKREDIPRCITTNWDSLLENAFDSLGIDVATAGVDAGFQDFDSKLVVHHPHGSFRQSDVVCSLRTEIRGV